MRALYKPRLMAGLLSGTYNPVGPYLLNVDITHRCNLQCPWCRFHSPLLKNKQVNQGANRDLDFKLYESACRDLAEMGTHTLQFVGRGESFLHPDFNKMVTTAKKLGLKVCLFTNGTLLNPERAEQLVEDHLDEVMISLWASSKEKYAALQGPEVEKHFDSIIRGIKLINRIKEARGSVFPRLVLYYALTRTALDDLPDMLAMAKELNLHGVCLTIASVGKELEAFRDQALSREEELETAERLRKLAPDLKASGLNHNFHHLIAKLQYGEQGWQKVPCNIGWFFSVLSVEGKVQACNRHRNQMGHLAEHSFKSIWNNENYRRFRKLSRDPKNLPQLSARGDCNHCCHLPHNLKIHRVLRWWPPACGPST